MYTTLKPISQKNTHEIRTISLLMQEVEFCGPTNCHHKLNVSKLHLFYYLTSRTCPIFQEGIFYLSSKIFALSLQDFYRSKSIDPTDSPQKLPDLVYQNGL